MPMNAASSRQRVVVLLLALVIPTEEQILGYTQAPINWSYVTPSADAPTSMPSVPRSCECVIKGASTQTCAFFKCNCLCDVTVGQCDPNCCCDTDCSAAELASFKSNNQCIVNEPNNGTSRFCADTKNIVKVNPKYRMRLEQYSDPYHDFMCVETDNSESQGDFFVDPGAQPVSVFLKPASVRPYAYAKVPLKVEYPSDVAFKSGDLIPAATVKPGAALPFKAVRGGFLTLPALGHDGLCTELNHPRFLRPEPNRTCVRPLPDIDTHCVRAFGSARYSTKASRSPEALLPSLTRSATALAHPKRYCPRSPEALLPSLTQALLPQGEARGPSRPLAPREKTREKPREKRGRSRWPESPD
jgi:hypothetical protein